MRKLSKRTALLFTTAAMAVAAAPARAQDAAPDSEADAGEATGNEIVVTARKRTETLQDIPSSIAALGAEQLGKLGADSLEEFAGQTPGLSLTGNRANSQIVLRGVTTGPVNQDQAEIKETVGLYLDESPIAVQRFSPNLKLYDLDRVEVLRGPQGTLYGAGSMAGAIRLITRKPNADVFEASAKGQLALINHGGTTRTIDAMVNIPVVTDVFAVRAVGFYKHNAGFIDNVVTGENNVNSEVSKGGRIAARITPGPATTIDALLSYQHSRHNARSVYAEEAGYLNTTVAVNEPYVDKNLTAALTVNQEFDPFDVTLVGSYRNKKLDYLIETGSFVSFVAPNYRNLPLGVIRNSADQEDYSAELRLASKPSSPVQWTIGAFYEDKSNAFAQNLTVAGVDASGGFDSTAFGAAKDQLYVSAIDLKERQLAIFGEVVVPVGDHLKATVGGRYFDAKQRSSVRFGGIFADPNIGTFPFRNKESGFNPKFNLSYEFDRDHMIYAQAAKGFRLGGTNEPVPATSCAADLAARGLAKAPDSYKSDSLWNYEVGAKTSWLDRALTVNVSAYHIDWKNPQVTAQLGCGFNIFVNAGGLKIDGGELETVIRPTEGLTIRGGFGYTNSRLTEDLAFVSGRKGDHAPFVPKWTMSGSIDYTHDLSDDLEGFVFLSYQGNDVRNTRFNPTLAANSRLPAYDIINARVGVNADRWSLELFVENLGNSRGLTNRNFYPFSLTTMTQMEVVTPRTIGIDVSAKF
jgi:outer membrane receptor protein involved in Fe transport